MELEKKRNLLKKIHQYQQQLQQQQLLVAAVNDDIDDTVVVSDIDYCKRMLEITKKERDDALDLVREIRKLMVKIEMISMIGMMIYSFFDFIRSYNYSS